MARSVFALLLTTPHVKQRLLFVFDDVARRKPLKEQLIIPEFRSQFCFGQPQLLFFTGVLLNGKDCLRQVPRRGVEGGRIAPRNGKVDCLTFCCCLPIRGPPGWQSSLYCFCISGVRSLKKFGKCDVGCPCIWSYRVQLMAGHRQKKRLRALCPRQFPRQPGQGALLGVLQQPCPWLAQSPLQKRAPGRGDNLSKKLK